MYLTLIFLSLILFSLLEVKKNKTSSKLFIVYLLLFYLLSFLRWERGTDWLSYFNLYELPLSYKGAYELPFWLLNVLFGTILHADYTIFLLFQATIMYFCLYLGIKKNCKFWILALMLIYVILGNGGIFFVRQTIAMAIIFFSYSFVKNKNYISFFICLIFACCFHTASIFAAPAIFLYNFKITKKYLFYIFACCMVVYFLLNRGYLDVYIEKFEEYSETGNETSTVIQYVYGICSRLILFFAFILFGKKNREESGLMNIYVYSMILYILFGSVSITLARMSNFVTMFQVFQMSLIVERERKLKKYIFLIFLILLFGGRTFFSVSQYEDLFVPYKSIFNKELNVKVY